MARPWPVHRALCGQTKMALWQNPFDVTFSKVYLSSNNRQYIPPSESQNLSLPNDKTLGLSKFIALADTNLMRLAFWEGSTIFLSCM